MSYSTVMTLNVLPEDRHNSDKRRWSSGGQLSTTRITASEMRLGLKRHRSAEDQVHLPSWYIEPETDLNCVRPLDHQIELVLVAFFRRRKAPRGAPYHLGSAGRCEFV